MKLQNNYDVGIYCRLSRDDNNGSLESMSIANQRQMLTDFVTEKGWNLKGCYVDDGWSGTNFERPDFQRMIRDAEAGKISGDSARMIADRLNRDQVDSPRFYHYTKMGRPNPLSQQKNVWGSATITQLLRNQVYLGHMVQGKREVISFKTKKRRQIDPEDWIIVENTHEPIISRELWDRVQARLKANYRVYETKRTKTVGLFAGILRCSDCGSPLAYMNKKLKNSEKGVYRCSRYNNNGGKACTPHYIDESDICAFVINDIRLYAMLAASDREQLANRLSASMKQTNGGEANILRTKIRECENRMTVIAATLKSLYEDKYAGKMPESVFLSLMGDFAKEQAEIEERLPRLRRELDGIREAAGEIEDWLSLIGEYLELETLDRATVTGLIESITVFERVKQDGKQTQELEIEYRFIGNLLQNAKEDIA